MIVTDAHVFFYGAWPSNFTPAGFKWTAFGETHRFFCTEQAFMWAKAKFFGDDDTADAILRENSDPMTCKSLGRMVSNYDDVEWAKVRYRYMRDANIEKYRQNPSLKEALLSSEYAGKVFVEASPSDCVWGIGLGMKTPVDELDDESSWRGTNLLGKCITEVRDILSESDETVAS